MRRVITMILILSALVMPITAHADGVKTALFVSGISLTVVGAIVLVVGNIKYEIENPTYSGNDPRRSRIDREHREANTVGGVALGLGLSTFPFIVWKIMSDKEMATTISVNRVNSTDLLMVTQMF